MPLRKVILPVPLNWIANAYNGWSHVRTGIVPANVVGVFACSGITGSLKLKDLTIIISYMYQLIFLVFSIKKIHVITFLDIVIRHYWKCLAKLFLYSIDCTDGWIVKFWLWVRLNHERYWIFILIFI